MEADALIAESKQGTGSATLDAEPRAPMLGVGTSRNARLLPYW